jgi:endoglucanase
MLTLAAMHVLNDTADPFFTRLQAGAFAAKKPSGRPCDAAFPCHSGLSKGAKIALVVVFSLVLLGISVYTLRLALLRCRIARRARRLIGTK